MVEPRILIRVGKTFFKNNYIFFVVAYLHKHRIFFLSKKINKQNKHNFRSEG